MADQNMHKGNDSAIMGPIHKTADLDPGLASATTVGQRERESRLASVKILG